MVKIRKSDENDIEPSAVTLGCIGRARKGLKMTLNTARYVIMHTHTRLTRAPSQIAPKALVLDQADHFARRLLRVSPVPSAHDKIVIAVKCKLLEDPLKLKQAAHTQVMCCLPRDARLNEA